MTVQQRTFSVAIAVTGQDSSALLSLVSMFHRRRVELLDAELTRPTAERRVFTATFQATWRQARTVEESLRNLVDVIGVELCEAPNDVDGRMERLEPTVPGGPPAG